MEVLTHPLLIASNVRNLFFADSLITGLQQTYNKLTTILRRNYDSRFPTCHTRCRLQPLLPDVSRFDKRRCERTRGFSSMLRVEQAYEPGHCPEEPHVLPHLHDSMYDRS
jgi:hypothetical protein